MVTDFPNDNGSCKALNHQQRHLYYFPPALTKAKILSDTLQQKLGNT